MKKKRTNSSPLLRRILERLKHLFGRKPEPEPEDPYAYRMAPVKPPPRGRSGATVAEIEDDEDHTFPPRQI